MKKSIINKIEIKLLITIIIAMIISFLFYEYLFFTLGKLSDTYPDYSGITGVYIALGAFISALIIFLSIVLIALNRRIKYLKYISKSVTNIKTQKYLNLIEIKGGDEIAQLAEDINTMSERLKENYEKEKKQEEAKNELNFLY